MDYKKSNAPSSTVTRDMMDLCSDTGNVYETVSIIGKRSNNLEEVFENREQIEISRYYEKLPKPTLIAAQEYLEGKIYYRNPSKEKEKLQ